jgi:hypothetical protein
MHMTYMYAYSTYMNLFHITQSIKQGVRDGSDRTPSLKKIHMYMYTCMHIYYIYIFIKIIYNINIYIYIYKYYML